MSLRAGTGRYRAEGRPHDHHPGGTQVSTVEAAALQGYGAGLLERSIGFALGTLRSLTPGDLERPTPCRGWNLRMLLRHVDDSLAALYEAIDTGSVRLRPEAGPEPGPEPGADGDPELVAAFRARASRLLGVWSAAEGDGRVVTVGARRSARASSPAPARSRSRCTRGTPRARSAATGPCRPRSRASSCAWPPCSSPATRGTGCSTRPWRSRGRRRRATAWWRSSGATPRAAPPAERARARGQERTA
ncbi:maleylpyruvate isomerase N-terminal domain-containing protein [Actinomadura sp. J1-007]|uniref:maleylpyruvate isomerase N-terminal domain-containing protein n=1 Tax=Actinomadura sp. J1-007 TaxID=2661913 RepID=UPI0035CD0717